jgi:alkylhydroperoxidase family enzyme
MGGHSQFLVKEFGLERDTVKALRGGAGGHGLTPKEEALVRFARKVAADPTQAEPGDVQALRAVGLGEAEVVEALSIVMLSAFTNTMAQTLKLDEDLERFGMREGYF